MKPYTSLSSLNAALCVAVGFMISTLDAFAATSISQHGITWRFDRDYQTGQYANGDYWVLGPVTIVEITPASITVDGRTINGSMLNPVAGPSVSQGFDSAMKANSFSATLNAARPNGTALFASNPLILGPGSSLVSTKSHSTAGQMPQLTDAAILTVVSTPPQPNSFRPPYCGTDKTFAATEAQLDYSKLKSLKKPASTPPIDTTSSYFVRPWIEIQTQYPGRAMHPSNNQPDYGRDIAKRLSIALLQLNLDYTKEEKRDLLVRIVQYGIDVFGAATSGGVWQENGGHNQGRKMPLILAGYLLGNNQILQYGDSSKYFIFQEDRQTFYVSQAEVDLTNSTKWDPDTRGGIPEPYVALDIGMPEWGILHVRNRAADNKAWSALYRTIASCGILGHVLTARVMGLVDTWNWPAIFDYYDRYTEIERYKTLSTNTPTQFEWDMWDLYRNLAPTPATSPHSAKIQVSTIN